MPRYKAVATKPGQPTRYVQFTPAEEAAQDFEEDNPPPPPTKAERITQITGGNDLQRLMFKLFFKLHNRLRVLEGKPLTTVDQFLTLLESELD